MAKKHTRNIPKTKVKVEMPPVKPIKEALGRNLTTAEMEKLVADATNPMTRKSWPVYPSTSSTNSNSQTWYWFDEINNKTLTKNYSTITSTIIDKVKPIIIPDNPSISLKCDCSCSQLEVEYDIEDNWFNLSMWYRGGQTRKMDWRNRLRWIWQILTKGSLWTDNIILNKEKAQRLSGFLLNEAIPNGKKIEEI